MSKVHWSTPLHSIPVPSADDGITSSPNNNKELDDKGEAAAAKATTTATVVIPRNGLYGFIFGRNNICESTGNGSNDGSNDGYSRSKIHFESRIEANIVNDEPSSSADINANTNANKNDESMNNNERKKIKRKMKIDKLWNELPIHCGCTFRATFQKCHDHTNTTTSIMLPLTSQSIDPMECDISKQNKRSDAGTQPQHTKMRVITSTNVARLFYIKQQTTISVEYVTACNNNGSKCDKLLAPWQWGLFTHRYTEWIDDDDSGDDNNDDMKGDMKGEKKNIGISAIKSKNIVVANYNDKDDVIHLPDEKRARCCTSEVQQHSEIPQSANKNNDDNSSNNNNNNKLMKIVNFYPKEARKKPLLCATCYKKFPTTNAIYKHSLLSHMDVIAKKGSKEYTNLFGPSVLRKPLHAAYDDDYIVVVVKHQGLAVQGTKWTLSKSNLLLPFSFKNKTNKHANADNCKNSSSNGSSDNVKKSFNMNEDALSKPRAVHRLDSATGGLLVVAKTHTSEVFMKNCFAARNCKKRYRAIVFGRLDGNSSIIVDNKDYGSGSGGSGGGSSSSSSSSSSSGITAQVQNQNDDNSKYLAKGIIDSPLSGKESITHYSVISYTRCLHRMANGWITTVDLFPITGRQHQLRKHMKLIGHPMWGDKRYGPYRKSELNTFTNPHVGADADVDADDSNVCDDVDSNEDVDFETATVAQNPHLKLCLWSLEINFPHPIHGKNVNAKINEPEWYRELRDDQEKRWQDMRP